MTIYNKKKYKTLNKLLKTTLLDRILYVYIVICQLSAWTFDKCHNKRSISHQSIIYPVLEKQEGLEDGNTQKGSGVEKMTIHIRLFNVLIDFT